MTPAGGRSGRYELRLGTQIDVWAESDGSGLAFGPSGREIVLKENARGTFWACPGFVRLKSKGQVTLPRRCVSSSR